MLCHGVLAAILFHGKKEAIKYAFESKLFETFIELHKLNSKHRDICQMTGQHYVNFIYQLATLKYKMNIAVPFGIVKTDFQKMQMHLSMKKIKFVYKLCYNKVCQRTVNEVGKLKICSKCKVAKYCSKKCQKYHWNKFHRWQCGRLSLNI